MTSNKAGWKKATDWLRTEPAVGNWEMDGIISNTPKQIVPSQTLHASVTAFKFTLRSDWFIFVSYDNLLQNLLLWLMWNALLFIWTKQNCRHFPVSSAPPLLISVEECRTEPESGHSRVNKTNVQSVLPYQGVDRRYDSAREGKKALNRAYLMFNTKQTGNLSFWLVRSSNKTKILFCVTTTRGAIHAHIHTLIPFFCPEKLSEGKL